MKKLLLFSSHPINLAFGLLLIRIIIGVLVAFYGYEKLTHFEEFAASEFWAKNVSFLGMTGKIPLALTIFAELFCSILLIFGLFTRLAIIPLVICMSYIIVNIAKMTIINSGDNGTEINTAFVYLIIYIALFFTGAGNFSFDKIIARR